MQISDIYGALFGAIILGSFAFAVLAHSINLAKRMVVIRWFFMRSLKHSTTTKNFYWFSICSFTSLSMWAIITLAKVNLKVKK